jgi:hypothetical protein
MAHHVEQHRAILRKVFARIAEYQEAFNNETQMRELVRPFIKTFLDTVLLDFLASKVPIINLLQFIPLDSDVQSFTRSLIQYMKSKTKLDKASIFKILKVLEQDVGIPDHLREHADECLNIFVGCFIGTPNAFDIEFDTPFYKGPLTIKRENDMQICTMYLHSNDVDKVRKIIRKYKLKVTGFSLTFKPRDYKLDEIDNILKSMNLNPENHNDRVLNYIEFPLSECNIEHFAYITMCISKDTHEVAWPIVVHVNKVDMKYLLANTEEADDVRRSIMEDFQERFQSCYFNSMISLKDLKT